MRGRLFPFLVGFCVVLLGGAVARTAQADLQGDMDRFFDELNLLSNVTRPGVYQGQAAGYYTGGSLFLRVPQRNYELLSVQWPRFRAGCGGIDLYTGGFSHINADELVNMLRNIGSAAVSHAFLLALRTVSPQIASTIEKLQDWAQRFNMENINSCEAGRRLLGGALKHLGMQQHACAMERVESQGESWAAARHACTTGGRRATSLERAARRPELDQLLLEGNLAWRALMRNSFFRADLELAELVMNLSGTLLVNRTRADSEDSTLEYRLIPSLFGDGRGARLLRFLIEGGGTDRLRILRCAPPPAGLPRNSGRACTRLAPALLQVEQARSLRRRVQNLLEDVLLRIRTPDRELTEAQQGLLENTRLPVYKYLTVRAAYLFESSGSEEERYAGLIARDLAMAYLEQLLGLLGGGLAALGTGPDQKLQRFREQLREVRRELRHAGGQLRRAFDEALEFSRTVQLYEQALAVRLAPQLFEGLAARPGRDAATLPP